MPSKKNDAVTKAIAKVGDEPSVNQEILDIMIEEGLGPRDIIRELKALARCDPSKLIEVDQNGQMRLRDRLLPKHAIGLVEISPSKLKMVDKLGVLKLAAELARMQPKATESKTTVNDNRQVFVALPPTISREEAFKDYIDAEVVEPKQIEGPSDVQPIPNSDAVSARD